VEQNANVCERRTFRQVYIVTVVRRAFSLVELLVVLMVYSSVDDLALKLVENSVESLVEL
jgi:prepilin-type N-terminal cleavage/methylation domain-containing protein